MSNTLSRRRDPFFAEFDNLVRAAFGPSTSTGTSRLTGFTPAVEAHRVGDDALIRLELPGVSTEDVSVEVKGRHLVVSGSRRDQREEDAEQSGGRRFSEFRYGSFTRAFRLSPKVSAEDVSASYDAGVLTVRVAGAYAEADSHKIAISSGTTAQVEGEQSQEG